MDIVSEWTGLRANALRHALRMSNEAFAEHLGVASRTVANWSMRSEMRPGTESCAILDTALAQAPKDIRSRFASLVESREASLADHAPGETGTGAQPLLVVIAVVCRDGDVLMVRRRGEGQLDWQFPAGIVKPGQDPVDVAVDETFAETGVACSVRASLGSRVHPVTGVACDYLLCDYLSGEPANSDSVENSAVAWLSREKVLAVVPEGQLYPPIERIMRTPATEEPSSETSIAAAIIVDRDSVLLVRRQVAEGSLSWQFPSGKVEPTETSGDAAVREAREEVDLTVEAVEVLGRRTHPVTGREMVYVACHVQDGAANLMDREELSELIWCPCAEVENYLSAGVFPPVLKYLRGEPADDVRGDD